MKILNKDSDLIGKTIKAINVDDMHCDEGFIITEDNEILVYDIDFYDQYVEVISNQNEILDRAKHNYTFRDALLKNGILSEEQYNEFIEMEKRKNEENEKYVRQSEYRTYLKLKEKFEGELD